MQCRLRSLICNCVGSFLLLGFAAWAQEEPLPLRFELLMQLSAELEEPQAIGDTPFGGRRIVYVKGGEFSGPGLKGRVLPGWR
jgi:hypothetical protein